MRRHITLSFRDVVGVEDEVLDVHSDQVGEASSNGTLTGEVHCWRPSIPSVPAR